MYKGGIVVIISRELDLEITGGCWSDGNSFQKHDTRHDTFTGHTLF